MSGGRACVHRPRPEHVVVVDRLCNHSAFNGYRWAPSEWSAVLCLACGARWRTRALWVGGCRDATEAEILGESGTKKPRVCGKHGDRSRREPLAPAGRRRILIRAMEETATQEAPVVSIAAQDLREGDVLIEDGADYLVLDVHDRVSGVYVIGRRDDIDEELHFLYDEPVARRVLA